jgi:Flp pilus assembly protein TadG
MRRSVATFVSSDGGAVAPTLALSLFALIAAGGIAFDYARMASLDTELQNAADQAALAAASQLDGQTGACERAVAAARNLIANRTLMANETGGTRAITIADPGVCGADTAISFNANASIRFYQDKAKTTPATDDTNAKFVEVDVDPREAFFAFTPIVAATRSGNLSATAFAGLGQAICRVPPLMMCNPNEAGDPDFTVSNYVGRGIRLVANNGGGSYGPGLFGFLEVGQGPGLNELRTILARQGDPGNCAEGSGVDPNPGNMEALRAAFNTRFDMIGTGLNTACGSGDDLCPPSYNTRTDLMRDGTNANQCGFVTGTGGRGWREPANVYPNLPVTTTPRNLTETEIATVAPMGYPRDKCHAFSMMGNCTLGVDGIIGDGDWDRYAYFRSHSLTTPANYSVNSTNFDAFLTNTFGTLTPTRYQVYRYELQNAATRLQSVTAGGMTSPGTPVCNPPGVAAADDEIDRRVLSVAVINCTEQALSPSSRDVPVTQWIDIFLTEPAVPRVRTESHDVYVEVVGIASRQGNAQTVQKAVPYLIE